MIDHNNLRKLNDAGVEWWESRTLRPDVSQ